MRYRAPQQSKSSKKRYLIFVVIAALLVAKVATDINGLNADARSSIRDSRSLVSESTALLGRDLNSKSLQSSDKRSKLVEFTSKVQDVQNAECRGQRGSIYGLFSSGVANCNKAIESLKNIQRSTTQLISFIDKDAELASAIPSFDSKKSFATVQSEWASASDKLGSIEVDDSLKEAKASIVSLAKSYADDWQTVATADAEHNADAYEKATDKLNQDYTSLVDAIGAFDDHVADLQTDLNSALADYLKV